MTNKKVVYSAQNYDYMYIMEYIMEYTTCILWKILKMNYSINYPT